MFFIKNEGQALKETDYWKQKMHEPDMYISRGTLAPLGCLCLTLQSIC